MDPLTAFVLLATEALKLVNRIIDTQPPVVQKQMWDWYVEDMRRWRALLKLDVATPPVLTESAPATRTPAAARAPRRSRRAR